MHESRLLPLLKRGAERKYSPLSSQCFLFPSEEPFLSAALPRCLPLVQDQEGIFFIPPLPSGLQNRATLIPERPRFHLPLLHRFSNSGLKRASRDGWLSR